MLQPRSCKGVVTQECLVTRQHLQMPLGWRVGAVCIPVLSVRWPQAIMLHIKSGGSRTRLQLVMVQVGGADETGEKKIVNTQHGSLFREVIFNLENEWKMMLLFFKCP